MRLLTLCAIAVALPLASIAATAEADEKVPTLVHASRLSVSCLNALDNCSVLPPTCDSRPDTLECCRACSAEADCILDLSACSVSDHEEIQATVIYDLQEFRDPGWCDENFDIYLDSLDNTPTPKPAPIPSQSPSSSPTPTPTSIPAQSSVPAATESQEAAATEGFSAPPQDDEDPLEQLSACFPSDAHVELANGNRRTIATLEVGDVIRVTPGSLDDTQNFAEVFFFSHRDPSRLHVFVEVLLENGQVLTLSPGHYTLVEGVSRLVAARELKPGAKLRTASGELGRIIDTKRVQKQGLFAPHTLSSRKTLVVDGVLVSEFTESIHPRVAGPLLQIVGDSYRRFGSLPVRLSSMLHSRGHWLAGSLRLGATGPLPKERIH